MQCERSSCLAYLVINIASPPLLSNLPVSLFREHINHCKGVVLHLFLLILCLRSCRTVGLGRKCSTKRKIMQSLKLVPLCTIFQLYPHIFEYLHGSPDRQGTIISSFHRILILCMTSHRASTLDDVFATFTFRLI